MQMPIFFDLYRTEIECQYLELQANIKNRNENNVRNDISAKTNVQ